MYSSTKQSTGNNRAVNIFRRAKSPEAVDLVDRVLSLLTEYETTHGLRSRARREKDVQQFRLFVEALTCDLAYHYNIQQFPDDGPSLYIVRNRTMRHWRYRPAWMSFKIAPDVLDRMHDLGLLLQTKGIGRVPSGLKGFRDHATTIKAGPTLVNLIKATGAVNLSDFACDYAGDEIVILKIKTKMPTSITTEGQEVVRENKLMDYTDSAQTDRLHDEMRTINRFLTGLELALRDLKAVPPSLRFPVGTIIDLNERHLKRYYTCGDTSFQSGGRLFNRPLPFWMSMSKIQRKANVTLDGGQIIELDYNSMNARLLYSVAEAAIPSELSVDLYAVPGFLRSRDGIKKMFSAMCFSENLPAWTMFPEDIQADMDKYFHPEERAKVQVVIEAIRTAHHPVKHLFGTGIGHRLQNIESNLMVSLLLEMSEKNIPALPVHDCLIVQRSRREEVRAIMLRVFQEVTGLDGKVKEG